MAMLDVRPTAVHLGAEIHGVDIGSELDDETVAAIRAALVEHKVVFFRDQQLDHAAHGRFARRFGAVTPAHVVFGGVDEEHPEVYSVAKHRPAVQTHRQAARRPWSGWHTDITAAVNPPFASVLRGEVVPPFGGDTQWVDMAAVYASLSPALRAIIDHLWCRHRYRPGADETYRQQVDSSALVSEHPMVTVHPESGDRVLNVNPSFVETIVGMTATESRSILELLYEQSIQPRFTTRFRWEPGSVAFWDNRSTMHLAPTDHFDTDFDRQFYRVTLVGEPLTAVAGRTSRSISGDPIRPVEAS